MADFCTAQDIIDTCGTTLDSTTLANIATKATRKIKIILKREGLGYTFSTVPDEIIEAASEYGSAMAIVRGMTDGKLPRTQSISGASATVDAQDAINYHNAEGDRHMREYIDANGGEVKPFRVVGRDGERVGEYNTMETAGTDVQTSYEEEV